MELFFIFLWLIFSILVGLIGKDRYIGFGATFVLSLILSPLIGLIIALFSKKISEANQIPRYVYYFELGGKEEFKGNVDKAIDLYLESLYHLENDYPKMKKKPTKFYQAKRVSIQNKIDNLKNKKQSSD